MQPSTARQALGALSMPIPAIVNAYKKTKHMQLLAKIVYVLSIFCMVLPTGKTFGQDIRNVKVNIDVSNKPLKEVFREIEKQTGLTIEYRIGVINPESLITIRSLNEPTNLVLDKLLKGTSASYVQKGKNIFILKTQPEQEPSPKSGANGPSVSGVVTAETGEAVIGARVSVKNEHTGFVSQTLCDASGKFSFQSLPEGTAYTFTVSSMGYEELLQTGYAIKPNETIALKLMLKPKSEGLNEFVVVGYGRQKRENLTGAVTKIGSDRLEDRPIASVGHGLQGVIPNLNISIQNGDPTTSATYNVRGIESISGGAPLILVDGVPMDVERLNPNDIESVTVLKDAASAAIYGARAAFGVILVETKKGKKGKMSVTLSTEQSLAKPIYLMDVVTDPYQYVTAFNEAFTRTSGRPRYDAAYTEKVREWSENPRDYNESWGVVNGTLQFYGNSDYQHKIITDFAPQSKYDLNISGATDKVSYYASFGVLGKDGYIRNKEKNDHYHRYNALLKLDIQANDWLKLDERITFNAQNSDKPHFYTAGSNLQSVARNGPLDVITFPDLPYYLVPGDRGKYEQYIGKYFQGQNWFPYLENGGRTTFTTNDTWFTQGVTVTPLEGLRFRGEFSYRTYLNDYQDVASKVEVIDGQSLNPVVISNGFSGDDYISNRVERNQYYVFNVYGEYELNKFKDHYAKLMVGYNQEWGRNNQIAADAYSLLTPGVTDIGATTGLQRTDGFKNHVALQGIFFRLNYIFKNKYLLESNSRYDGSSRFPRKSRFGFFPSLSVGWRISSESFMRGTREWLDDLKLRASYGELGNQMVGYYPYISTMVPGMSPYIMSPDGQTPYVSAPGLVSPTLTWETVTTKNLGLDLTMLKRRLNMTFDIYTRDTRDMLMKKDYPDILGTDAPSENAADLRTKGWELAVSWSDNIGKSWRYGLRLALSDNQTTITRYDNPTGALAEYYVGQKLGEIWGFKTVGIFQSDEAVAQAPSQTKIGSKWKAGDIQYADLNGDKEITLGSQTLGDPGDYTIIGNTSPRYSFGINPDISYKNWTLNIFFQGLFRDYLPGNDNWHAFYPFMANHVEKYFLTESWSENNRDAYFPAMHNARSDKKNYQPQSRYVQNAAYIRLKNLTLNYNLPDGLMSRIGIQKAQVYVAGMNLWEFTKMHRPLDPEDVFTTQEQYYLQRIYSLGAKVTF